MKDITTYIEENFLINAKTDIGGDTSKKKRDLSKTKMTSSAYRAAYGKMKAWHDGTRKQNLKNCSDAKLRMNYEVCLMYNFDKECKLIEDEAYRRNITL